MNLNVYFSCKFNSWDLLLCLTCHIDLLLLVVVSGDQIVFSSIFSIVCIAHLTMFQLLLINKIIIKNHIYSHGGGGEQWKNLFTFSLCVYVFVSILFWKIWKKWFVSPWPLVIVVVVDTYNIDIYCCHCCLEQNNNNNNNNNNCNSWRQDYQMDWFQVDKQKKSCKNNFKKLREFWYTSILKRMKRELIFWIPTFSLLIDNKFQRWLWWW